MYSIEISDYSYPAFPVFAFVAFVVVLIPLPWHFQAWNSGTCLYMIWTAVGCLNLFINSIVWHGNAINHAPIWCDISSRLVVGIAVAIPAASLCINRRLYKIATVQTVTISRAQKHRNVMIDMSIGLGIPILQMVLQYIVEGHRYNIFEDIGCFPATFNTPLAYPLSIIWPTVIGLASAVYCILTLHAFMKRRTQFTQFASSNTSLTMSRYFRLMALATVEVMFTTPISAYGIYLNVVANPLQPWKGFADAHFNYSKVLQFPSIQWRMSMTKVVSLELSRWSLVFCAFVFFAFFGFADEARKHYRMAYWTVMRLFGVSPVPISPASSTGVFKKQAKSLPTDSVGSLPVYIPRLPFTPKRGSVSSSATQTTCNKTISTISESPVFPQFRPNALYDVEISSPRMSTNFTSPDVSRPVSFYHAL